MTYTNTPLTPEAAKALLALDLDDKVITTLEKLDEWYTAWDGQCYVSLSGGKDSTVLAYLAARYLSSFRTPRWPLNLVFINTGLEYPEVQHFVNDYAAWLRRETEALMRANRALREQQRWIPVTERLPEELEEG